MRHHKPINLPLQIQILLHMHHFGPTVSTAPGLHPRSTWSRSKEEEGLCKLDRVVVARMASCFSIWLESYKFVP